MYSRTLTHAHAWVKSRSTVSAFRLKKHTHTPHRAMSYITPHLMKLCGDLRPQLSGALAELQPFTDPSAMVQAKRETCPSGVAAKSRHLMVLQSGHWVSATKRLTSLPLPARNADSAVAISQNLHAGKSRAHAVFTIACHALVNSIQILFQGLVW